MDSWVIPKQQPDADQVKAPQGITIDASMRFGVDVHDTLSFSAKACISCHGIEMDHVVLDWQPKPWFNAQFGRLNVPFGEYANRIDQSGHKTTSAPLIYDMGRMAYADRTSFNSGVIMLPYVDTGVMLYGQTWLGSRGAGLVRRLRRLRLQGDQRRGVDGAPHLARTPTTTRCRPTAGASP